MASSSRHAQLSYTEMFTADELIVEFDGVAHTLANKGNGKYGSGSSPNSINPIGIIYVDGVNTMYIDNSLNSGNHHVVIKSESSSIETTECFKKAVEQFTAPLYVMFSHFALPPDASSESNVDQVPYYDKTYNEVESALRQGRNVYIQIVESDEAFENGYAQVLAFVKHSQFGILIQTADGRYTAESADSVLYWRS